MPIKLKKIIIPAAFVCFVFLFLTSGTALAFDLQVKIPGLDEKLIQPGGTTKPIGEYIRAIYNYATGIVGILAVVVMMFGGIIWITAFGNAAKIGEAKAWIGAALTGLVLALTSFMILQTVNPALVNLNVSNIPTTKEMNAKYVDNCSEKSPRWGQCGDKNGDAGWCRPLEGDTCEKGCICDPNYKPPGYVNSCKDQSEFDKCIDDEGQKGACQKSLRGLLYCRSALYGCCEWDVSGTWTTCDDVAKDTCRKEFTGTTAFSFEYGKKCLPDPALNLKKCQ